MSTVQASALKLINQWLVPMTAINGSLWCL